MDYKGYTIVTHEGIWATFATITDCRGGFVTVDGYNEKNAIENAKKHIDKQQTNESNAE